MHYCRKSIILWAGYHPLPCSPNTKSHIDLRWCLLWSNIGIAQLVLLFFTTPYAIIITLPHYTCLRTLAQPPITKFHLPAVLLRYPSPIRRTHESRHWCRSFRHHASCLITDWCWCSDLRPFSDTHAHLTLLLSPQSYSFYHLPMSMLITKFKIGPTLCPIRWHCPSDQIILEREWIQIDLSIHAEFIYAQNGGWFFTSMQLRPGETTTTKITYQFKTFIHYHFPSKAGWHNISILAWNPRNKRGAWKSPASSM